MKISGFTIVRNAIILDFPILETIRSILPMCDEVVVNVGRSDDGTLELVRTIADPKLRIIESEWDMRRGESVLRDETRRAMEACRHRWGVYIQADEVLHEDGAVALARTIEAVANDPSVEGVVVRYRHLFGDPATEAVSRKWYRREVRAVRLEPAYQVHPFRDAQGFRVGPNDRKVRARLSAADMFHYGYIRSATALRGRVAADRSLYPAREQPEGDRAILSWFPGLRPFVGTHPVVAGEWLAAHAHDPDRRVSPPVFKRSHLRLSLSNLFERITGVRPFEFRNYDLV